MDEADEPILIGGTMDEEGEPILIGGTMDEEDETILFYSGKISFLTGICLLDFDL